MPNKEWGFLFYGGPGGLVRPPSVRTGTRCGDGFYWDRWAEQEDTLGEAGVASPALGAIAGCAYGVTQTGLSPMRGDTAAE